MRKFSKLTSFMEQRSSRAKRKAVAGTLLLLMAFTATATNFVSSWQWELPDFFPEPRTPDGNLMSPAKVALGRHLFFEQRLSGNGSQSCASCHDPARAFTDAKKVSIGSTGESHTRNAQGLANAAYHPTLTWANPALVSLEKQMEVPLFGTDPVEMGVNDSNRVQILERLKSLPLYQGLFAQAYPSVAEPIKWEYIIQSIATFERTLISGNSLYDQHLAGKAELSDSQIRGMDLFFGEKAECFHCHGSFNFNDQTIHSKSRLVETPFHNTGLYNIGGKGGFPESNRGVFELTHKNEDMGTFRAPSLRNIEITAPYMHDGSISTLEEVLDFYAAGGRVIAEGPHAGDGRFHSNKNDFINQIELNAQEKSDIVSFLKTLTDEDFLKNPKHSNPFNQN